MKPTFERLPIIGGAEWHKSYGTRKFASSTAHSSDISTERDSIVANEKLGLAIRDEVRYQILMSKADIRLEIAKEVRAQYGRLRTSNIIIAAVVVVAFVCFAMWVKP